MANHLVREIVEQGFTVEVERLLKGEARMSQFCDHSWVKGYGDLPICRRKARRRLIICDSEGRLCSISECCDRPGCFESNLDGFLVEVLRSNLPPSEARTEKPVHDIFDDLDDGLLDRDEADRLFAVLDAHDAAGGGA